MTQGVSAEFEPPNPVLPAEFDLLWSFVLVVLIAVITLAVVALVQTARSNLAGPTKAFAAITIVVAPLIGPIAWLVLRPDRAQSKATDPAPTPSRTIHHSISA